MLTGIIGDDATRVSKVFHCTEVGAIYTDLRRTVRFSWREFIQHLILIQADGEAEVPFCIRDAVGNVPESFLRVGKKGAVVSKQQLDDEFLHRFRACRKTPKVDHTTVCSETDVDAVWHVLLAYGA